MNDQYQGGGKSSSVSPLQLLNPGKHVSYAHFEHLDDEGMRQSQTQLLFVQEAKPTQQSEHPLVNPSSSTHACMQDVPETMHSIAYKIKT